MHKILTDILNDDAISAAVDRLTDSPSVRLAGLWGSADALVTAAIAHRTDRPVLAIVRNDDDAEELADDLSLFTGQTVERLAPWEAALADDRLSEEVTGERLRLCRALSSATPPRFIIASVLAMLQPVPSPDALRAGELTLTRSQTLEIDDLLAWLVDAGYEPADQVDSIGEFAHRGGIVDILGPAESTAVRIEFFGDEIDSIRRFDLDTHRSVEAVEDTTLVSLRFGDQGTGNVSLLDHLPDETLLVTPEPAELTKLAADIVRRWHEDESDDVVLPWDIISDEAMWAGGAKLKRVELFHFQPRDDENVIAMDVRSLQRLTGKIEDVFSTLDELAEQSELWVFCETEAERERFEQLLEGAVSDPSRIRTQQGLLRGGFAWESRGLVVVGHHEIFHRHTQRRHVRKVRAGRPIENMLDLQRTDYVVHVSHGIARFEGLRTLERDGGVEEYLSLRFADNATLHVPASEIHLVQKYIGTRGQRPTLSKLGGKLWNRQKARVADAVRDLAADMIRTQAMRSAMTGSHYPASTTLQQQFVREFRYTETTDQLAAMADIDADMAISQPMDRLLCGDVGFGKTELAMRAAMKVVEGGKQVAVLVPTTVLADQHYRTFTERFADFPVRVEMISRYRTASEQAVICKDAAEGRIDVLIGTHRILSDDVQFRDLGLAIVDEEQRFGVADKEHLKRMRASVDVLTLSATPIPRTLHMALLGLRDISALATAPLDRRAIHTEVCEYNPELIRTAIHRELNREGQVFFLHNRVQDIQTIADRVRAMAGGEARVGVGHGQMRRGELEEVMSKFVRGKLDVLVSTTIIESGLDIPSANTIIINEADRFGLSELHQLRGRVGRSRHRAFCYLLLPMRRTVNPTAKKRLKAIEEFSDLGAGFQIAMRDLEIRGAGNLLGREQSGHIAAVGYELYCQLLEQTVAGLQGREVPVRREVHIDLGLEAFIPKHYVASDRQRMELYRRLAKMHTPSDLTQLRDDLADAYGRPPQPAETLLSLAEIRLRAHLAGIDAIQRKEPDLIFQVRDFKLAEKVFDGPVGSMRLPDEHTAHWRLPKACFEPETLLNILLKRLRQAGAMD
jgi:transcription-repair coupling factor (superfamily II helicase)